MVTDAAAHPRAPATASQRFSLEQTFCISPDALWPYVTDTDRINRAAGVAEARGQYEVAEGGRALIGRATQLGFSLEWVEHPFEHVMGQRFGVLREYRVGPLAWLRSTVELERTADGGTLLKQSFEAQPRSLVFAPIVAAEIGVRLRRAFQRVYRELAAFLATPLADRDREHPFDAPEALGGAATRALDAGLTAMAARGVPPTSLAALEIALRHGDPMELARLRPLEIAERAGVDADEMIDACLIAADVGLLELRWDLLCPHCRVATTTLEQPDDLYGRGHCEACAVDIGVDPAGSIELVFRPHPSVRAVDAATYCLGAPVHHPHVVAQQLLAAGERLQLKLALASGQWLITAGPGFVVELEVSDGATAAETTISLASPPARAALSSKGQLLLLENDTGAARQVRIERAAQRVTILTAARAAAHALELRQRDAAAA